MLSRKHLSRFVHFVPGAITLFFGMFALYSSLLLIRAHENIDAFYENHGKGVYEFHEFFYDFEIAYDKYAFGQGSAKDVIDKFSVFYTKFQTIQKKATLLPQNDEYTDLLAQTQSSIQKVAVGISAIGTKQDGTENSGLHERIAQLHTPVVKLYRHLMSAMEARYSSDEIAVRQNWLYWSVIAMGLSGFVLTLLISDKIRQLQESQKEKLKNVLLLENRLAALEAARDGIIIINNQGILTYMNHSMSRILGLSEDRGNTSGIPWTEIFLEDDAEIVHEDIIPEIEENGYWTGEFPIYHDNGHVTQTDFSISRLPDGGYIATVQDISEKQKVEEEKRQLEDQFYQAQKMEAIGRLAGGIAHDFNNILAAMNGYAEFLADDLDAKSEQHTFALNILQAGRQAKELVEQMLMFSRRSDSSLENLDLISSVQETVSMLNASLPRTIEMVTSVVVDYAPIRGNPTQISQVVMNLCVNAKDAMEDEHGELYIGLDCCSADHDFEMPECVLPDLPDPKGTPMLRIADMEPGRTLLVLGHLKKGQAYVRLRVRDTGSGMSRTIMERVFEPFFTTKSIDKGTGLGLATVHGVIIGHQAAMVIDSTIGAGTIFDLYFPQVERAQGSDKLSSAVSDMTDAEEKGIHVLLVEDQAYVRNMTEKMLERMGYTVFCAQDGLEALSMLKETPDMVDIVITDQNMPKMTGIELVDAVYESSPHIPFILLSGYSEKEMRDLINKHPAIKAVLKKPVSKAQFEKVMTEIVKAKQERNAAA